MPSFSLAAVRPIEAEEISPGAKLEPDEESGSSSAASLHIVLDVANDDNQSSQTESGELEVGLMEGTNQVQAKKELQDHTYTPSESPGHSDGDAFDDSEYEHKPSPRSATDNGPAVTDSIGAVSPIPAVNDVEQCLQKVSSITHNRPLQTSNQPLITPIPLSVKSPYVRAALLSKKMESASRLDRQVAEAARSEPNDDFAVNETTVIGGIECQVPSFAFSFEPFQHTPAGVAASIAQPPSSSTLDDQISAESSERRKGEAVSHKEVVADEWAASEEVYRLNLGKRSSQTAYVLARSLSVRKRESTQAKKQPGTEDKRQGEGQGQGCWGKNDIPEFRAKPNHRAQESLQKQSISGPASSASTAEVRQRMDQSPSCAFI